MRTQPVRDKRRGVVLLTTAISLVALMPIVGLAVDVIMMYMVKARLSAAVDASVLAASRALIEGPDDATQTASAVDAGKRFFAANFPSGAMSTYNLVAPDPVVTSTVGRRTVTLTAKADAPLYFLRFLSLFLPSGTFDHMTVAATGSATRRDVNLVLVLDRSASLTASGNCENMKAGAASFVSNFAPGRDRLGMVVFGGHYVPAYAPTTDFANPANSLSAMIGTIVCGSNTGSAQALWQGYENLKNIDPAGNGDPNRLNLLVFFTDGLPNGISADFGPYMKGGCSNATPKIGWIAQTSGFAVTGNTNGIFQDVRASVSSASDALITTGAGCSFAGGSSNVRNDITQIPPQDRYGNTTSGSYYTADLTAAVTSPYELGQASRAAADSAATRIRNNATVTNGNDLRIIFYTIGLGAPGDPEPPDPNFMRRISNDPKDTTGGFDSSRPSGLYVPATDGPSIQAAFTRIAAEITRLTN